MEIYNEEVRDLLHLSHTPPVASLGQASAAQGSGLNVTGMGGAAGRGLASRGAITIREDAKGRIIMAGASICLFVSPMGGCRAAPVCCLGREKGLCAHMGCVFVWCGGRCA